MIKITNKKEEFILIKKTIKILVLNTTFDACFISAAFREIAN